MSRESRAKPLITQTRLEVLTAEHCSVAFLFTGVATYSFPPPGFNTNEAVANDVFNISKEISKLSLSH